MGNANNKKKFTLDNNFENMFKSSESINKPKKDSILNINIEKLVPFKNHPFKLYEGERLTDMIESVKANGIIMSIIVRPLDNETYEILSGHNRVEAAKAAGLETVPAVVREDLSDDEALLIVTETNLIQRSFSDLTHSERAIALKTHMEAISKQGKRNDLIDEINELLNADKTGENSTLGQFDHKLKSRDKTADKYGLAPRSVSRYIRLCELNQPLLDKVDGEIIAFISAVLISHLLLDEQTELNRILDENKYKVDIKKAELLRDFSESKKLTADKIEQILSGELNKKPKPKSLPPLKIKPKIYTKYFDENMKQSEMESIVDKALEEYFIKHK